jgi:hypothetical protein
MRPQISLLLAASDVLSFFPEEAISIAFQPRKSSPERRMRAVSSELRFDEAGEGSVISPEQVRADSAKE